MSIKSSQKLVEEANEIIETLSPSEIKSLVEKNEITLVDVRDIRELWRDGTIENAKHIPRGMLEFWLDPNSSYYQENKIKDTIPMKRFGNPEEYANLVCFLASDKSDYITGTNIPIDGGYMKSL